MKLVGKLNCAIFWVVVITSTLFVASILNYSREKLGRYQPQPLIDDPSKFHVITFFFRPIDEGLQLDGNQTSSKLREDELVFCLRQNLQHELVGSVTVIVRKEATERFLKDLPLPNRRKLRVALSANTSHAVVLKFASEYFRGKVVLYLNQDVTIDAGFEKIDVETFKQQNIVYALTRHVSETECKHLNFLKTSANCNEGGYNYIGSHDAFVMCLKERIPDERLGRIDVEQHMLGEENILIYWLRTELNFRVTNPCKVLKVVHHHCIPIRNARHRIFDARPLGLAEFTDSLL